MYLLVGMIIFEIDGFAAVERPTKGDTLRLLSFQLAKIGYVNIMTHFHVGQFFSDQLVPVKQSNNCFQSQKIK